MSGYFESGEPPPSHIDQPPVPIGQPAGVPDPSTGPAFPAPDGSLSSPLPDWSPAVDGGAPKGSLSMRTRVVMVAVALSVVAAVGVVAASVGSRAGGVHAALASVSSSPTLKVVISAHTTLPQAQAVVSQYSVAVTVTSENGHQPLSGSDGVDDYEVSVLRGGVDVCDVIMVGETIYLRVNLQAIDPSTYTSEEHSLLGDVPPGSAHNLAVALLSDRWVGVDETTIESIEKSLGEASTAPATTAKSDHLRNVFTLSFAQAWDAWASIHQLSSSNGVTRYSVKVPVQHFVSTFFNDVKGAILKAVPSAEAGTASMGLNAASSAIDRIPAALELPITLSVTNGSLTGVDISYDGNSVNLAISHPAVGVTAPAGAEMITTSMIHSLLGHYGLCPPVAAGSGAGSGSPSCMPTLRLPGSSSTSSTSSTSSGSSQAAYGVS